jgi:hypothetical protein
VYPQFVPSVKNCCQRHYVVPQWVGLGLIPDSDLTRRPGLNQISGWRQACA